MCLISPDQPSLGARIKRERIRQGLSQLALSKRFKCSVDSIQHWERDESLPQPQWREAICQFLNQPYEALFPDEQKPSAAGIADGHVRDFALNDPLFKQGKNPVTAYFQRPLFQRVCAELHAARASGRGGVIIIGPAMVGKTRMALEALRQEAPDFTLLMWSRETFPPEDLSIYTDQDVAWLLDDPHELPHERDVQQITQTLRQLQHIARRLIVVATTRSGTEGDLVLRSYRSFIQALGLFRARLQSMEKGRDEWQRFLAFADAQRRQGQAQPFDPAHFDGTPGSVLLGLDLRTEALRYPNFPPTARAILMALALLRKAGIYHFPERRVRRVAESVFEAPPGQWFEALDYLVQTAWISLSEGNQQGESTLNLFTDAYLDVCLAQSGLYPLGERLIEDDFPALAGALSGTLPDAEALFKLSDALYLDRGRETWAEWNELGWKCANRGLAVLDPERDRELWAEGQYALGMAYWRRWHGILEENMQHMIAALNAALRIFTRERHPTRWAAIHRALGMAYAELLQENREDHLERAITHYRAALEISTRQEAPQEWARIQHNLGVVYERRTRGGQEQNLDRAIAYYQAALTIRIRATHPTEWAMTLNNLGELHLIGAYGKSSEHQEEAIRCFQLALEVRTREAHLYDWAITQTSLGIAYRLRLAGDRAANIEQSIAHFTAALEGLSSEKYKLNQAHIQSQLGQAYVARIHGSRQENLAQARAAYDAALEANIRDLLPLHWAETMYAKALLHETLADDAQQSGDHLTARHEREQALALLREALEIYTVEDFPEQHTTVAATIKCLEERQ